MLDVPSGGLVIRIANNYDWMPWGGFGWIWIWPSYALLIPLAKNYDWMPWGGLGWIWMYIHLYQTFQLPKYASGCRGAGFMNVGCALMWNGHSNRKKLRLHALGRVWLRLDVASSVYYSICKELRMDAHVAG